MPRGARLTLGAVLAAGASWFAVWLADPLHWHQWTEAIDILWLVVAALAGCAALISEHWWAAHPAKWSFRLLGVGLLVGAAGQTLWTYEVLVGDPLPYPSFADLGYLGGVVFFGAAALAWPRTGNRAFARDLVEIVLAVVASALVIFEFAVRPVLAQDPSGLGGAVSIGYAVGGLGLSTIALIGLLFDGWDDRGPFVVVLASLFLCGVATTMYGQASGLYAYLIGPLWTLPVLGIAVAACARRVFAGRRLHLPEWARIAFLMAVFLAIRAPDAIEDLEVDWAKALADGLVSIVLLATLVHGFKIARQRNREAERLVQTRAELERSYAERDAALEASRTGVALFENRTPRFCNRAFIELLNPTVGGGDWPSFLDTVEEAWGNGADVLIERDDCMLRVGVTELADGSVLVTVDDVTEEERERASRDRFVVEVLRARDREVRKISELLHDDAVQELSALALRLEVEGVRTAHRELGAFADDVNAITASIRKLLVDLHPPVLESRGLAAAIDSAADPLRAAGVQVHVDALDDRFAPELELLAYSVAQEALSNVSKHGRAERVVVSLAFSGGLLECMVEDDGCGFDPVVAETALSRGGLGLHLSRERLELVRGTLAVDSAPGRGTMFRFSLPLSVSAPESMVAA